MSYCDVILIPRIAEVISSEDTPEKVRALRLSALRDLKGQLAYYQNLGYAERLIQGIAEKRSAMIMRTSTKTEMQKVMTPRAPHYDGAKFVPDEYNIPEEEIIAWSQTSLKAPLNSVGFKRYMELFSLLFPEEKEKIKV